MLSKHDSFIELITVYVVDSDVKDLPKPDTIIFPSGIWWGHWPITKEDFYTYLDVLRNEQPVYGTLDKINPSTNSVNTEKPVYR